MMTLIATSELMCTGLSARSAGLMIPTTNAQPSPLFGRLDGQDEVRRSGQDVEGDHSVIGRFNLREAAILVNHAQQPTKLPCPSRGQIDNQSQLPAAVVVRMGAQEVPLDHRVSSKIVAPAQGHARNGLKECLEFGALECHTKLQVGQGIRARLELGRRPYQLTEPEETILIDRKSTRLNSSHGSISYAVFCLKKK